MPDCFISHSSIDVGIARFIKDELRRHGVTSFLASVDVQPGDDWTEAVWKNLECSKWVLFLASRAACRSAYVQQEIGAALHGKKNLVPIVWNLDPSKLPGWINRKQAIDFRGELFPVIQAKLASVARRIKADQGQASAITGAIIVGLLLWAASQKSDHKK